MWSHLHLVAILAAALRGSVTKSWFLSLAYLSVTAEQDHVPARRKSDLKYASPFNCQTASPETSKLKNKQTTTKHSPPPASCGWRSLPWPGSHFWALYLLSWLTWTPPGPWGWTFVSRNGSSPIHLQPISCTVEHWIIRNEDLTVTHAWLLMLLLREAVSVAAPPLPSLSCCL